MVLNLVSDAFLREVLDHEIAQFLLDLSQLLDLPFVLCLPLFKFLILLAQANKRLDAYAFLFAP
jgi:hypothetical protein